MRCLLCSVVVLVLSVGDVRSGPVGADNRAGVKEGLGTGPIKVKDLSKELKDRNYTDDQGIPEYRYNDVEMDRDEQRELFGSYRPQSPPVSRTKRTVIIKDKTKRWPKVSLVPYEINRADFHDNQIREMLATFAFLETETCIAFRERTDNDVNYVKIADCGGGCWAHLGKSSGPYWQKVCLGDGCKWPGLYAHEFGHTLGLQHEHQRPDRDGQIDITEENIASGAETSFTKFKPEGVLTTKYDFASAMHYERTAFAKAKGLYTITARKDWNNQQLGDVWWKMYSYNDIKLLNQEYGCGAACKSVPCPNGFVNKECRCVTREDYYKKHCRNPYGNDGQCDHWASIGECQKNSAWMYFKCRKSCKACFEEESPDE